MKKAVVLALLALPPLFAAAKAISFHAANANNGVLISGGIEREYILHLPRNYDRSKPVPLVISLHGAGGWPAQQQETSRWNEVADREGFIVVYPAGVGGGPRTWGVERGPKLMRDVGFISDLIDALEASYNIDRDRIYANGLSNGGGMSFVLSCTMSDRIAAVGLVGSAQTLPWSWCTDRHAVPMIAIHGTADRPAPYDGGVSWISMSHVFPSIPKWTSNWARRNGCDAKPVESAIGAEVTRREYTHCTDDASVVLYTVLGGGHTWPGGVPLPEALCGTTTTTIDASAEMWTFFREHPRPLTRRFAAPSPR